MTECLSWDEGGITFRIAGGARRRLTALDLYECAPLQFDPQTGQRRLEVLDLVERPVVKSVAETAGGWRVALEPVGEVDLGPRDLEPYLHPSAPEPARIAWDAAPDQGWPVFDYEAVLIDADTRRRCLLHVARFGMVRVAGAPRRLGEVERFIAAFGHVRETNYGRVFNVRVKQDADNLADTDRGLAPHADNPYRAPVPRLQALHCLEASEAGGETRLVDGLAAAQRLKAERPEAFELLCTTPVAFEYRDAATRLSDRAPLLRLDHRGELTQIRCNNRSFKSIDAEPRIRDAWRGAYRALCAIIEDPAFGCQFRLAPGEIMMVDNHRVLHGRTAYYSIGPNERHLQGAYAEADGLYSTLRLLTEAEVERRVAEVVAAFEHEAMLESYGEDLSIREHMLQSADLAADQGLDEVLVGAALLHDLGWAMPGEAHEAAAATFLNPLLGPAVAEPIRLHVAAKQYLVTREPGYFDLLSDASRRTLVRQGGPMTEAACADFERLPGFAAAVALRRLDDHAKTVGRTTRSFESYAGLLRRLAVSALNENPFGS